ncbi:outer membrane protein assembly factor BamE [Roseomonas chloroacetimidivorans]|jgi:outer membrane protein assembly factor BamE (lipoprotein component of BamABCDE complex)|uniref:outer membrane protein assembly factor BamE n=1 Tax=Roseomonas chloroacetimidivorans TaxID=1766656 RepID=UPI003C714698
MVRPTAPVNPPVPRRHGGPDLGRAQHSRNRPGRWRAALLASALLLAAPLGGCSLFRAPEELRGNRVDAEMLRELTPGVASRADVSALLGSPTATSTFDQNEWFYISATTRVRPGRTPGVDDQRVVVIRFDDRGIVQGIRQVGQEEMRSVAMVERTTPVPGNERSVLQALFGNIGRFGPSTTSPAGPGASSPGR